MHRFGHHLHYYPKVRCTDTFYTSEFRRCVQCHLLSAYTDNTLIAAIPKCFHTKTQSKAIQAHNDFIFKYVNKATTFDLQSYHQAILNHISVGTLSGSAQLWDRKVFTVIQKIVGTKVIVAINYVNRQWKPKQIFLLSIKSRVSNWILPSRRSSI